MESESKRWLVKEYERPTDLSGSDLSAYVLSGDDGASRKPVRQLKKTSSTNLESISYLKTLVNGEVGS